MEINIRLAMESPDSDFTDTINAALQQIPSDGAGVLAFPPGRYLVNGNVHTPANVSWDLRQAVIELGPAANVVINGAITGDFGVTCFELPLEADPSNSRLKIRNSDQPTWCSPCVEHLPAMWFSGSDIGERINKAFQVGGTRTTCILPSGKFRQTTRVDMGQTVYGQNLVLKGQGHLMTTLEIAKNMHILGVDLGGGRECRVSNIRVIEESGSRVSACIRFGGTSCVIENSWFGNAKYGIVHNQGAGTHANNIYVEACDYGMLIGSAFADWTIEGLSEQGSNVQQSRYHQVFAFDCGKDDCEDSGGLVIAGFGTLQLESFMECREGDQLEGQTTGHLAVVHNASGVNVTVARKHMSGYFTDGEAVKNLRTGASVNLVSRKYENTRDLQFTQSQVMRSRRNGAVIGFCDFVNIQGNFSENGVQPDKPSAGCVVGERARNVSIMNSSFRNNKPATGVQQSTGLHVNGPAVVSVMGCQFGNSVSDWQRTGILVDDVESMTVIGCAFERHRSEHLTDNTGKANVLGCIGVSDKVSITGK